MGGVTSELDIVVLNFGPRAAAAALTARLLGETADGCVVRVWGVQAPGGDDDGVAWPAGVLTLDLPTNDGFGPNLNTATRLIRERLGQPVPVAAGLGDAGEDSGPLRLWLFLNPDVEPAPGFVASLVAAWAATPEPAMTIVGPVLVDPSGAVEAAGMVVAPDGRHRQTRTRPVGEPPLTEPVAAVPATAMLVPEPLWQRLGGFDPDWFMYFEDADLCLRARLLGADVLVVAGLRLIHRGAGTQGTGPMAQLRRLTRATDGHLRYVARWGRRDHAYEPVLDGLTTAGYNLAYAVKLVVPALLARARKPGPRRP
jgi:GT2 family glycosyltransferase